jgi:hypothetical protein
MTKKMKILVSVVVAVFVLSIVGTVAVMAQTTAPLAPPAANGTPPVRPNINAQVAKILGIEEVAFTDALKAARIALAPALIPAPSTPAVPPATPTKPIRPAPIKPADLYAKVDVILSKPAGTVAAAFKQAEKEMQDLALNNSLENAVTKGKITSGEKDQIKAWYQSKPAALDKLGPMGPGPMAPNMGRQMNKFENHLNNLQNQFNRFKGRMNGPPPQPPPLDTPPKVS